MARHAAGIIGAPPAAVLAADEHGPQRQAASTGTLGREDLRPASVDKHCTGCFVCEVKSRERQCGCEVEKGSDALPWPQKKKRDSFVTANSTAATFLTAAGTHSVTSWLK